MMSRPEEKKPHVTWDEETIERHNLDRGTRMKIDEPNTPYHYYAADDDTLSDSSFALDGRNATGGAGADEPVSPARSLSGKEREGSSSGGGPHDLEWGELQKKLERVQQKEEASSSSTDGARRSEWDSSGDERDERDDHDHHEPMHFAERDEEGHKVAKDPKFAEKRKRHYNEFMMLKAWKQAHLQQDEDEEEENEQEEQEQQGGGTLASTEAETRLNPPAPCSLATTATTSSTSEER